MDQWKAVIGFFGQRWFKRIWVLQEIVLGNPTDFIIGNHILEAWLVQFTAMFLCRSDWSPNLSSIALDGWTNGPLPETVLIGVDIIWTAANLKTRKQDGPQRESHHVTLNQIHSATTASERCYGFLEAVIFRSWTYNATDMRDIVFAPSSLASRLFLPGQQQIDWLVPEYRQSPAATFLAISTLLLKKLPTLSILSLVLNKREESSIVLPSWVPDFSLPRVSDPLIYNCQYNASKPWNDFDDRGELYFPIYSLAATAHTVPLLTQ